MSRVSKHSMKIHSAQPNLCGMDTSIRTYKETITERQNNADSMVNSVPVIELVKVLNQECWCGQSPVVVGESANNNGIASARNVNGNNAVSNSNDNWAPRFALKSSISEDTTRHVQQGQILLEKTTDYSFEDVMELLQCEYSSLSEDIPASESSAKSLNSSIWEELHKANQKRHLKNLKRFIINREIVEFSVDNCLDKAADSPQKKKAVKQRNDIINRIIQELSEETYQVGKCTKRVIKKRGKDGKNRNANIFPLYDRCVQNVLLTVIKEKCVNILLRNVYSGVAKRSTISNDRRYCLFKRIHDFCTKHPDAWVGMTDIHHFYESLDSHVVCQAFVDIVKDRYVYKLLCDTFLSLPTLPIGGTLSQLCAMLTLNECDREILRRFKPKFYAIFGDNRLFGDNDKHKLYKIKEFQDIYYETRYGFSMKTDYSFRRVSDGFRFCKTDFKGRYTHIRSELKHRTIRGQIRGQQHYAGYKGFLLKTDSKRLRSLIENQLDFQLLREHKYYDRNYFQDINMDNNQNTVTPNKLQPCTFTNIVKNVHGPKMKLIEFVDKFVIIGNYCKLKSKQKEDGKDYYKFQLYIPVIVDNKRTFLSYTSWNGSADITYFFDRLRDGSIEKPKNGIVKVKRDGPSFYFEGYRDYVNHRGVKEIEEMGLDIDASIFESNGSATNLMLR